MAMPDIENIPMKKLLVDACVVTSTCFAAAMMDITKRYSI